MSEIIDAQLTYGISGILISPGVLRRVKHQAGDCSALAHELLHLC